MDNRSLQAVIDRWSVGETDWARRDITTLLAEINRLRGAWNGMRERAQEISAIRTHFEGCEASHTWCWIEKQCDEALGSSPSANGDSI